MQRDNSVFEEINRGDEFAQDIVFEENEEASEESYNSDDSEALAKARQVGSLNLMRKREKQSHDNDVDRVSFNIDKAIDAI